MAISLIVKLVVEICSFSLIGQRSMMNMFSLLPDRGIV
jgi:hypothetical protein